MSVDLSIDNAAFENGTIRVLSLVPTYKLLALVLTPVFTTIFKLEMTLYSVVTFPGTSVDITVLIIKSTFTFERVGLPMTVVLVAIGVVAFTIAFGLALDEFTLVEVIG